MASESFIVGVAYLVAGDWRKGGYWVCAAALTVFITV